VTGTHPYTTFEGPSGAHDLVFPGIGCIGLSWALVEVVVVVVVVVVLVVVVVVVVVVSGGRHFEN
jgi:predicted metal-binding membrane protein